MQPSGQPTTRPVGHAGEHAPKMLLDGGAIAGIVIGIVAALGIGIGYNQHQKNKAAKAQEEAMQKQQEEASAAFDVDADPHNTAVANPLIANHI